MFNFLGGEGFLELLNVIVKNDMSEICVLDLMVRRYKVDRYVSL